MRSVKSLLVETQKLSGVTLCCISNLWAAFQNLQSTWAFILYHLRFTGRKGLPCSRWGHFEGQEAKWSSPGHTGNSKPVLLARLSDSKPKVPLTSHCLPDFHLCDPDCSATKNLESFVGIKSGPLVFTWPGSRTAANTQEPGRRTLQFSPSRKSNFLKDSSQEGLLRMQNWNIEIKKTDAFDYITMLML